MMKKKNDEGLQKWSPNAFKFYHLDINKPALILQKGVYPYEYMDSREKFIEAYYLKKRFAVS